MKKLVLFFATITLSLSLIGCGENDSIEVPNFVGQDYGDVLAWSKETDVEVLISSEVSDLVEPRQVITQDVEPGTKIQPGDTLTIVYSRGYDPEGEVSVPDFTGLTESDVYDWIQSENISKFYVENTFHPSLPLGSFVGYEVVKTEEREEDLRKDTYYFYFSQGQLDFEPVEFDEPGTIRGVNLGGWFVLEGWMSPELFEGVSGSDETIFMEEKPNAEAELIEHWNTFITEADFAYLASKNITHVRLPIPWWFRGDSFSYTHEGVTHNVTYADSSSYIHRAMTWAETYGINVLLDLHTAPGGQNGFDNGGISGVLQWPNAENVAKTVEVISDIAETYSVYDSLWGIEVLNEPGWGVDMNILQDYYFDAYVAIREHNTSVWVGFHDGFRNYMVSTWSNFFNEHDFHNIFFDMHLYQTFGDGWGDFDIIDHVNFVHNSQAATIAQYDGIIPVVIGEWSLGLQGNVYDPVTPADYNMIRIAFANAQFNVFEESFGWYFWSYKIDRGSHLEWDMRRLIDQGLIPNDYSTEEDQFLFFFLFRKMGVQTSWFRMSFVTGLVHQSGLFMYFLSLLPKNGPNTMFRNFVSGFRNRFRILLKTISQYAIL